MVKSYVGKCSQNVPFATTSVWDSKFFAQRDFSSAIDRSNSEYGDIALQRNGNVLTIWISAFSNPTATTWVGRFKIDTSQPMASWLQNAQSPAAVAGSTDNNGRFEARGIAVSPNGTVIA